MKKVTIGKVLFAVAVSAVCAAGLAMAACGGEEDDKSAYEIWLEAGHTGTEQDFMQWVQDNAQSSGTEGLAYYPLPDGTYAVGAGNALYLTEIVIPARHNGAAVTEIVPEGFASCSRLKKITIPETIVTFGADAFMNCDGIAEVHISDLAAWCRIDFQVDVGSPFTYDYKLYLNGGLVTDLVVPDGITKINNGAFCGCTSLVSVTLPDGVTDIGAAAFSSCTMLESVRLPENITELKMYVFSNAESLEDIDLPDSLTKIGSAAFGGCDKLNGVTIPDGVTEIGASAFSGCYSLTDITVPDGVATIGNMTFNGCHALESVYLPDGITGIGDYSFAGCTSLTGIRIPDGTQTIGDYAFNECSSLQSIILPASLIDVGDYTFDGCALFEEVYYGGTENGWRQITFRLNNIAVQTAPRYYYSQSRPAEDGNFWHYDSDGFTPVKW